MIARAGNESIIPLFFRESDPFFAVIFETLSKRKLENRKGGWKPATDREISREESNEDHLFLCNVRNTCTSRLTSPRAEIERLNWEEREEEKEGKPGE